MTKYEEEFNSKWESYKNENKIPNILLLGKSGVGKSSLVNSIFGIDLAKVSNSKPETQGFNFYDGEENGISVNLIDSAGYEANQGKTYYEFIKNGIKNGITYKGRTEKVNLIWYCISVRHERIEPIDLNTISKLNQEKEIKDKICIVFTKCDLDTIDGKYAKILRNILQEKVGIIESFETSTDNEIKDQLDTKKLIKWSVDHLDEDDLKENFVAAQKEDLETKKEEASKIIKRAVGIAGVTGAAPIPFSDAVLLVPVQVDMTRRIINIYGISSLVTISESLVSDVFISQLGKSLVTNILKIIPVVGSVVGGTVSATIAASITGALGVAVSEVCFNNVKRFLNGEEIDWENLFIFEELIKIVKEELKKRKW
jgi:uncharacterized protein (DUF697 family)/GTP-binding protein EngB required for normal cell division